MQSRSLAPRVAAGGYNPFLETEKYEENYFIYNFINIYLCNRK
jgi:hypothetical protein